MSSCVTKVRKMSYCTYSTTYSNGINLHFSHLPKKKIKKYKLMKIDKVYEWKGNTKEILVAVGKIGIK